MEHPTDSLPCPSTYSRLLLQRWPTATERLLAGTGLSPELLVHHGVITVSQQLRVLRNARTLAAREDWALDFGRQLNINSHGPLGFASISAPTLGAGIETLGGIRAYSRALPRVQRRRAGSPADPELRHDAIPAG